MKRTVLLLRACYGFAAIFDAAIVGPMVSPDRSCGDFHPRVPQHDGKAFRGSGGTMTFLETVRQVMSGDRPPAPLAALVGYRVTAVESGRARVEVDASARHANPMGTVHGGVICTIADTAMGAAYGATLGEGETFVTLELKINFLRPVQQASLIADAVVVQRGRSIGLAECTVTDGDGRLVAKAMGTLITRRG